MKERDLNSTSRTNWEQVDSFQDNQIDTTDIPPLDDEFFNRVQLRTPSTSTVISVAVDPETLIWFTSQGLAASEQTAAALRIYAEAQRFVATLRHLA